MSLQACMFGRPYDIPKGLSKSIGSQPQIEEVDAAATGAAVVCVGDNLPSYNGMSELSKLQTVGTTDTLKIAHTLDKFRGAIPFLLV